jgi:hypothetical protein
VTAGQILSLVVLATVLVGTYLPQILTLLQDEYRRAVALNTLRHGAVILAVLFALSQFVSKKSVGPDPRPVAVSPVTMALQSAPSTDKAKVRGVYRALADVTQRDAGRLITSTSVWRAIHSDALRLAVGGTDLLGKYPGLDVAVEETLAKHFSLDNLPLTEERVKAIVAGCLAVEAECE